MGVMKRLATARIFSEAEVKRAIYGFNAKPARSLTLKVNKWRIVNGIQKSKKEQTNQMELF